MTSESIGQRIQRLRLQRGIRTQKEFARMIGIDPASLNQIEKGYRVPKLTTVDKMTVALGVSRDDILDGDAKKVAQAQRAAVPAKPAAAPDNSHVNTDPADGQTHNFELSAATRRQFSTLIHAAIFDVLADVVEAIGETLAARAAKNAPRKVGASSSGAPHRTPHR